MYTICPVKISLHKRFTFTIQGAFREQNNVSTMPTTGEHAGAQQIFLKSDLWKTPSLKLKSQLKRSEKHS